MNSRRIHKSYCFRILLGLCGIVLTGLLHVTAVNACPYDLPVWAVNINGQPLKLEVAESFEARQCGLSERTSLAPDRGMLFVFPRTMPVSFWMEDTQLTLSIAFLDEEGRIVDIQTMTPGQADVLYQSPGPVRYAIEVNWGWFSRHKVRVGDIVHLADASRQSHGKYNTEAPLQ